MTIQINPPATPANPAPVAAPAATPTPAQVDLPLSADEQALAALIGEDTPAPAATPTAPAATPAPAQTPAATPPTASPLDALDAARAAAETARIEAAKANAPIQAAQTTQLERERQAAAREAEATAKLDLLKRDPLAFAREHNIEPKVLLERLIQAGRDPAGFGITTQLDQRSQKLESELEATKQTVSKLSEQLQRSELQRSYEASVSQIERRLSDKERFPIASQLSRNDWATRADALVAEYTAAGVDLGPDPFDTVAHLIEREFRQNAERAAKLLGYSVSATPPAPAPVAGLAGMVATPVATAPAPATPVAPPTLSADLSSQPPAERVPQSADERDELALRVLLGGAA